MVLSVFLRFTSHDYHVDILNCHCSGFFCIYINIYRLDISNCRQKNILTVLNKICTFDRMLTPSLIFNIVPWLECINIYYDYCRFLKYRVRNTCRNTRQEKKKYLIKGKLRDFLHVS